MFCPECGKPNPEENSICQECGALLIDNSANQVQQPPTQTVPAQNQTYDQQAKPDVIVNIPKVDPKKVKSFVSKKKAILIPVFAVAVVLIAFFAIGSSIASPEKVVDEYFTALTENDYDDMYNQLALPESEFLTKENFTKLMESYWDEEGNPYSGITSFMIDEVRNDGYDNYYDYYGEGSPEPSQSESPIKNYMVTVVNKSSGETRNFNVTLIEQDTKKLLFFKNYKVSSAEYISENISIGLDSENMNVSVDGIALTASDTSDYGQTIYSLPVIFRGTHNISISSDLYETFETEFNCYSNDDYVEFYTSDMRIKEEILTSLESSAFETLKTLYSHAMGKKSFPADAIKTTDEYTELSDIYKTLVDRVAIKEDGTGLNEITFNSASISKDYDDETVYSIGTDDEGRTYISFNLEVSYTYKYTSDFGWFTSKIEQREDSDIDYVSYQYTNENGSWVLSYLDDCYIY